MRSILNRPRFSSCAAGVSLAVLTLCICAAVSSAQKPIILSQTTTLGALPSGGSESSSNPVGGTMAVTSNGDAIIATTYGSQVVLFNGRTGATTIVATPGPQSGAVAVDGQDNLFIGFTYTSAVVKLPYVNGAYAAYTNPSGSTPACTGKDTVECSMVNVKAGTDYPIVSLAFDSQGDLFYGIQADSSGAGTSGITNPNSIWECNAACLYAAHGTPVMIFQEPAPTATPGLNYQLTLGGLAIDPSGNIFFTDGFVDGTSDADSGFIYASNVNELPLTSGSYPTTATVLYTNSQSSSPGKYVDAVTGVNVDSNGTVYFTDLYDGVAAIPNNGTPLTMSGVASSMYTVSTQGLKLFGVGRGGNIFGTSYDSTLGGDAMFKSTKQFASGGSTPVAKSVTSTNLLLIDNLGGCTSTPAGPVITLAANQNGNASTEFTATAAATSTCAGTFTGASDYAVTLAFDPAIAGERQAILTATDTTNTGTGTSTLEGVGQGALITLDPGVWITHPMGFQGPTGVAVDGSGNIAVADTVANTVFVITAGSTTPTAIGTNFSGPEGVAYDAGGNLYVADTGNNQIDEFPNVNGTVDPTIISDTFTFDGTALNGPAGLAFGPEGVLYIGDTGNNRVVTYNPNTGVGGVRVTGTAPPAGIAVDQAGTLYVAYPTGASVVAYQDGTKTPLAPSSVSNPGGLALDASGSLFVSDLTTGDVVRIPNIAGTLTATSAITVEKNPLSGAGIATDSAGDLITADTLGKTVYSINRTAASLNFGSVDDDSTVDLPLWVESAGNTALTFGSPIFTAPTNTMFSLAGATTDGCTSSSGAVGTACQFSAAFAPPNDAAAASQTGTTTISSNALNAPSATVTLSGTNVFENLEAQTISFLPPASIGYTTKPITLTATATSALPVTFTLVSGPATLSGSTLTITGIGSIVIKANQAGNSTWAPAPTVTRTIAVVKAAQTISFTPKSTFTYPVTAPYTLTATASSGLAVKFAVVSGPATIVGSNHNELKITGAGAVRVAANQAGNADYDAAVQDVKTIKVDQAKQTISFTKIPASVPYGETITLAATSTSKLPVTFSVISGPATVKGDKLTITGVGKVEVGANQLGNANWGAAVEVIQKTKGVQATLDVTAKSFPLAQGSTIPQLTYTITGLAPGDQLSKVVTGTPVLSTTATSNSAPGKYPITVNLGTLAVTTKYKTLYTLMPVNGTLTITKKT